MSLDEKISSFLDRAKAKPASSKLEPYTELIKTLRQRRWTYAQIARALLDEFAVQVHPTTVHAFVKVRARGKKALVVPAVVTPAAILPKKPRFNLDA